jgi:hypothetical protein
MQASHHQCSRFAQLSNSLHYEPLIPTHQLLLIIAGQNHLKLARSLLLQPILIQQMKIIGLEISTGIGYDAAVARDDEATTIGGMQLDASFSPIKRVLLHA